MAIQKCSHCTTEYWRYRADHPPKRFCSVVCSDQSKEQKPKGRPPEKPQAILRAIKDHNRLFHNADSHMIEWDCDKCDELQGLYVKSLNWWAEHIQ